MRCVTVDAPYEQQSTLSCSTVDRVLAGNAGVFIFVVVFVFILVLIHVLVFVLVIVLVLVTWVPRMFTVLLITFVAWNTQDKCEIWPIIVRGKFFHPPFLQWTNFAQTAFDFLDIVINVHVTLHCCLLNEVDRWKWFLEEDLES
jgi:hypothetical protein